MSTRSPFQTVGPFRLVENFMGEDMVTRLLALVCENQEKFEDAEVYRIPRLRPDIRTARVSRDLSPLTDELSSSFRKIFPWALQELGIPGFDIDRLELELAVHGDGAHFKTHIDTMTDHPDARTDRALTGVYYFHRQPKAFSGGELRLCSIAGVAQGGEYRDIIPPCDSLLLFPSWFPHEVRLVSCPSGDFMDSRFAINCWYRRARIR